MNTTIQLILNNKPGYEMIKQKKGVICFIIVTLISGFLTYFSLSGSVDQLVSDFNKKSSANLNLNTVRNFMSILIIAVGALFPFFTIATNSFLFFLASKFFISDIKYKYLFRLFTYLYPLTIIANLLNFIPKYFFGLQTTIRLTSINAILHLGGKLGTLLNGIDFFQIWILVIVYFALQKIGNMPKSSSLITVISYFIITTVPSVIL